MLLAVAALVMVLAPWTDTIVSVAGIMGYATLCGLATLGHAKLGVSVIESEGLAGEREGMKELLDAWMTSNFCAVLGLRQFGKFHPKYTFEGHSRLLHFRDGQ